MIEYSIIVPTYNRASLLAQCLGALALQIVQRKYYEIILINDGSRDRTDEIAETFKQYHPDINFTYIKQKNGGPAKARNAGIKVAKGKIIFFTDDDCTVPSNWLKTLLDAYERYPDMAGVGGWYRYPEQYYKIKSNLLVQYQASLLYLTYKENAFRETVASKIAQAPVGNTANMSYLKSILENVGGFDEEFNAPGFEDWELMKRVFDSGRKLLYLPFFVTDNKPPHWNIIIKRWFTFGRGRYLFVKKHPDTKERYLPAWNQAVSKLKNARTFSFGLLSYFSFLCTRLGWEYQKLKD